MLRRQKRTPQYELTLVITDDDFVRPPNETQRNAILNRLLSEYGENLEILHEQAAGFVSAVPETNLDDRTNADLADQEIMEDWQIPLMEAMAETVCRAGGDVLEIGFGRGIASDFIQNHAVKSHTIIECNQQIIKRMDTWRTSKPDKNIRIVEGRWQDTIGNLAQYDGIFFHTYPLNSDEYMEYVAGRSTFAQHFFESASSHLRPGGVFSYLTNEIDSLSRAHQRALFRHFESVKLRVVDLDLPDDVTDTWWANSMVLVEAVK